MSNFLQPFDFEPAATFAKNGSSHTVTSGYYAWVSASVYNGGTVTVDGTAVLECGQTSIISTSGTISSAGSTTVFTANGSELAEIDIVIEAGSGLTWDVSYYNGTSMVLMDSANALSNTYTFDRREKVFVDGGDEIRIATSSATALKYQITGRYLLNNSSQSNSIGFWAEAGNVISGTGSYNLMVSEFLSVT